MNVDHPKLTAALEYAKNGYRVLPVIANSREPAMRDGIKHATDHSEEIHCWSWGPGFGVGIATTGLVVIEIEELSHPWSITEPYASALWTGAVAKTPRGGLQHWFRSPDGFGGRNSLNVVALGVRLVTNDSFAIAAPTVRPSGAYSWVQGDLRAIERKDLPLLPEVLCEYVSGAEQLANPGWRDEYLPCRVLLQNDERASALSIHADNLRRSGSGPVEIQSALHAVNAALCDPPLPATDIDALATSMSKKRSIAKVSKAPSRVHRRGAKKTGVKGV